MRGYAEVSTKGALEKFEDDIDGFLDAIVKEVHLLNRSYVEKDGRSLFMGNGFDVQLIFQSQNRDHEFEVILSGVQSCQLDADVFDDGMKCSITTKDQWPGREICLGGICAWKMFYRTRPKSGQGAVLGPELPSPSAIPATLLQPGWRQCSGCADAWEEADQFRFSRCPSCGTLTDMVDTKRARQGG